MTPEKIHPENSPDKSARSDNGGSSATGGNAEVHDKTGLLLAIAAFGFALFAAGMQVNRTLSASETNRLQEQAIDAKIKAGMATAEAMANNARIDARVALDKIEDARTKLAEKGIHLNLNGH